MAGSGDFSRSIRDFSKRVQRVADTKEVPLNELFNDGFMRENSQLPSFEALLDSAPVPPTTEPELRALLESDVWNTHVAESTRFDSWTAMQQAGLVAWAKRTIEQK